MQGLYQDPVTAEEKGMHTLSGDPATIVLRQTELGDTSEVSLDREMLKLLMVLDGNQNLAEVAKRVGMSTESARSVARKLVAAGLAEALDGAGQSFLDRSFMHFLASQLSIAMGPIAHVVMEDEIFDMGEVPDRFPASRGAELINLLARQIPREEKRFAFQQAMIQRLKEFGI